MSHHPHSALFYEDEKVFFTKSLLHWAIPSFLNDNNVEEAVVVIARNSCTDSFSNALQKEFQLSVDLLQRKNKLVFFDASKLVESFSKMENIDQKSFDEYFDLVSGSSKSKFCRIYGEVPMLLINGGKSKLALQFEEFWHEASKKYPFELLCSYSAQKQGRNKNSSQFDSICSCHHAIIASENHIGLKMQHQMLTEIYESSKKKQQQEQLEQQHQMKKQKHQHDDQAHQTKTPSTPSSTTTTSTTHKQHKQSSTPQTQQTGFDANSIFAAHSGEQVRNLTSYISYLCHEIRNPLHGITGGVSVLHKNLEDLQQCLLSAQAILPREIFDKVNTAHRSIFDTLNDISSCVVYQSTILNDNLDVARMAEGKFTLNSVHEVNIPDVLLQVVKMFKSQAIQKGLSFRLVLPNPNHQIRGFADSARIKQVVSNLVTNAIKFTEKGSVEITLKIENSSELCNVDPNVGIESKRLEVIVSDTGIGMNDFEMQSLFDRFGGQGKGSSFGSSGLGLFFSKNLAKLMGGDLIMESAKGKGTSFHFYFNLSKSHCNCITSPVKMFRDKLDSEDHHSSSSFFSDHEGESSSLLFASDGPGPASPTPTHSTSDLFAQFVPKFNELSRTTSKDSIAAPQLPLPSSTSTTSSTSTNSPSPTTTTQKRILIVDDNEINRKILASFLKSTNHELCFAGDGEQALRMHLEKPFQLMIMDLVMPNLDGISTTKIIRQIEMAKPEDAPRVSIVAVSATDRKSDFSESGADDFISKPFKPDQILQKVSQWMK